MTIAPDQSTFLYSVEPAAWPQPLLDPIDHDLPTDVAVTTTRRALVRLALVASEAGARFQREGDGVDPMAWMLTPRRLFDGGAALDAVLGRDGCLRALLLHGLGLGLDADPGFVDALAADDGEDWEDGAWERAGDADEAVGPSPRLYTATTVHEGGTGILHAVDAAVLPTPEAMRARVATRLGAERTAATCVYEGFPAGVPLVDAMVADPIADLLSQVAAAPTSRLASGLDVILEQRFDA